MSDKKSNPFNLIKHRGEPNTATFEGVTVTRQKALFADDWGLVTCVPYDNHFVFHLPQGHRQFRWEHMCTCGSLAGMVTIGGARMWACIFYHRRLYEDGHGYHQTGIINKDDFENIAGQTIELPKGKRWLI